jgi:hypothetical protein
MGFELWTSRRWEPVWLSQVKSEFPCWYQENGNIGIIIKNDCMGWKMLICAGRSASGLECGDEGKCIAEEEEGGGGGGGEISM